jgi:hypothetical protein
VGSERIFQAGDRVKVTGGYDADPTWLDGGTGYVGRIEAIVGKWAAIKLDSEVILSAPKSGWDDVGEGASNSQGKTQTACGDWLAIALAYKGAEWKKPIARCTHRCVENVQIWLPYQQGAVLGSGSNPTPRCCRHRPPQRSSLGSLALPHTACLSSP